MDFAVHVDWIADGTFEGAIKYCRDLGVKELVFGFEHVPGYRERFWFDAADLRAMRKKVEDAGLSATIMNMRPPQSAVRGEPEGRAWREGFMRSLTAMGEAGGGIVSLHLTANLPEATWAPLVDLYREMITTAEDAGVRIAIHTTAEKEQNLLWDWTAVDRLFREVPSPNGGLTFCVGNMWRSDGPKIYDLIRAHPEWIMYLHVRSTRPETGQKEYWLDIPGGPDFVRLLRLLRTIDFKGALFPEHMPAVFSESKWSASSAWAIGYVRGLLQALDATDN